MGTQGAALAELGGAPAARSPINTSPPPQQIMKDKWINIGYEGEELKPYREPEEDFADAKRIGRVPPPPPCLGLSGPGPPPPCDCG